MEFRSFVVRVVRLSRPEFKPLLSSLRSWVSESRLVGYLTVCFNE